VIQTLVFPVHENPENPEVNDVTFLAPSGGMTEDCWWTHELGDPKPARARIRCSDGQVRTLNVIQAIQGLFIEAAEYMGAGV